MIKGSFVGLGVVALVSVFSCVGCAEEIGQEETASTSSTIQSGCYPPGRVFAAHALHLRHAPSAGAGSIRVVSGGEGLQLRGSLCTVNGFLLVTDAGGNTGWIWADYLSGFITG
jgi:hypothetical protein